MKAILDSWNSKLGEIPGLHIFCSIPEEGAGLFHSLNRNNHAPERMVGRDKVTCSENNAVSAST